MRLVLGVLLMLEGFSSGLHLAQLIPVLVIYSWLTVTLLFVRAAVGVVQFASGWMLFQDRPFGSTLGRVILLVSALLTTLEIGWHLVPTSLFHTYRWPAVGLYWAYAIAGVTILKKPGFREQT